MSGRVLAPGGNRDLASDTIAVSLDSPGLGPRYALAIVPLAEQGAAPPDDPWLSPWNPTSPFATRTRGDGFAVEIRLSALSIGTPRVACIAYAVRAASTLRDLGTLAATVDGSRIEIAAAELAASAILFAELYRRGQGWKLRARQDGVFAGLAEFGRRMGRELDDGAPGSPAPPPGRRSDAVPRPGGHPDWTGSGFLVSRRMVVTNAHVVEGASSIAVTGFEGSTTGCPVIVDTRNDLALVRLEQDIGGEPLAFRTGGPALGESAVAVGYPLAGLLGSGPQVAHGTISGLLGPGEDVQLLQITTPIQPGSSGGPLLDGRGHVIGVVAASLTSGQNVNFAVRGTLAETLLEAAGRDPVRGTGAALLDLAAIARMARGSVWRLECREWSASSLPRPSAGFPAVANRRPSSLSRADP